MISESNSNHSISIFSYRLYIFSLCFNDCLLLLIVGVSLDVCVYMLDTIHLVSF